MTLSVMIVEDEGLLAMDLGLIVQRELNGEPVFAASVAQALRLISHKIAFAFLDIEILGGKSYPVARKLIEKNIPLIFVSGNDSASLPDDLKGVPFLPKPVDTGRLVHFARSLNSVFA